MLDAAVTSIRDRLGLEDAFAGFRPDPAWADRQGWNSNHPFLAAVLDHVRPALVIELGVWKGMSAIHMAGTLRDLGIAGEVLAIDTWLGSSAHLSEPGRRAELKPEHGYPTLYRSFLTNVAEAGLTDRIVPLPMDGASAAVALDRLGVRAGVIHVDASHEHDACLRDLAAYWPLLDEDGVMIVDDYGTWPGVTRAVCAFAATVDRPVFGTMGKAILPKSPDLGFELKLVRPRRSRRRAHKG